MVYNNNNSYWPRTVWSTITIIVIGLRTIWSTTTTTVTDREQFGPQQQLQLIAENHMVYNNNYGYWPEKHVVHNKNYSYGPRTIKSTTTTIVTC
jgi:hypothetical protein